MTGDDANAKSFTVYDENFSQIYVQGSRLRFSHIELYSVNVVLTFLTV